MTKGEACLFTLDVAEQLVGPMVAYQHIHVSIAVDIGECDRRRGGGAARKAAGCCQRKGTAAAIKQQLIGAHKVAYQHIHISIAVDIGECNCH